MEKLNVACIGFANSGKSTFVKDLYGYVDKDNKFAEIIGSTESIDLLIKEKSSIYSLMVPHYSSNTVTEKTNFFYSFGEKKQEEVTTPDSILEINLLIMPDNILEAHKVWKDNARENFFVDFLKESKKIGGINACLVFIEDEKKNYLSEYIKILPLLVPSNQIIFIDNCTEKIEVEYSAKSKGKSEEKNDEEPSEEEIFQAMLRRLNITRFIKSTVHTEGSVDEEKLRRKNIMKTLLLSLTKQAPKPSLNMMCIKLKKLEAFEINVILPYLYENLCEIINQIFDIEIIKEKLIYDVHNKFYVKNKTKRKYFDEDTELFLQTLTKNPKNEDLAKYISMLFSQLNKLMKKDWSPSVKSLIKNANNSFVMLRKEEIPLVHYYEMYNLMKSYNENQSNQNRDSICLEYRIYLEKNSILLENDETDLKQKNSNVKTDDKTNDKSKDNSEDNSEDNSDDD
jgi:hypothetical protein